MNQLVDKLNNANKNGLEALKTLGNASLDAAGQLTTLNLQTARAVAERGAENLNCLLQVRNLEGLMALRQPLAMAAVGQSFAYSRRAYEICSESSNTMLQVFEGQLGTVGGGLLNTIDKGRKTVSPAVDFAVAAAKSLMSMAKQNYGQFGRLAGALTERAEVGAAQAVKSEVKLIEKTA